jgi:fibronectin type 3 domain-containing protein
MKLFFKNHSLRIAIFFAMMPMLTLFLNCSGGFTGVSTSAQSTGSLVVSSGITSPPSTTGRINLAWDPVTDPRLVRYFLHYGSSSGKYTNLLSIDSTATTVAVNNLTLGTTYYFVTTSVDEAGIESAYSNEASGQAK